MRADGLESPEAGPESGGGIQLDWWFGTRELELHVQADRWIEYLKVERGQVVGEGRVHTEERRALQLLVDWLLGAGASS